MKVTANAGEMIGTGRPVPAMPMVAVPVAVTPPIVTVGAFDEYGFSSWRALTAEIDRRRAPNVAAFFRACTAGDVEALRELLNPHAVGCRDAAR